MPRTLFAGLWCAACLLAVDPRPKATDYPAHAESAALAIGAEYLVHSFSNGSQMYVANDYLVVDTAVYPHGTMELKRSGFSLRLTIQGGRHEADATVVLQAEAPQMVAYAILSSFNAMPPELRGVAGQKQPRTRSTDPEDVSGVVTRMSLPEDTTHSPLGGYLFFAFRGNTKKIKAMDLVYGAVGGDGGLVAKLF